ncbi:MAG TPA: hypothetical protein VLA64_10160 [Azonexus sp.]|nr:hypothetical protein [Azonexus sp.]
MKATVCSSSYTFEAEISPLIKRQKMHEPGGEVSTKWGIFYALDESGALKFSMSRAKSYLPATTADGNR